MKADLTRREVPVHKRLGGGGGAVSAIANKTRSSASITTISKRLGQVNIQKTSSKLTSASAKSSSSSSSPKGSKSVFDRLGYGS